MLIDLPKVTQLVNNRARMKNLSKTVKTKLGIPVMDKGSFF